MLGRVAFSGSFLVHHARTPGMSSSKKPRAGLYARVSTTDQNPRMQIDELREFAARRGYEVVGEYVDHGVSGTRDRRPELDRLLALAHRGKLDVVVCWRFDRFARNLKFLLLTLDDFRVRGIDFVSLQDNIDTSTPTGRLAFAIIGAVAEMEREMNRDRTRSGIAAARRRGAQIGRPRVRVDVKVARELLAEGMSIRAVAKKLGVGASTLTRALRGTAPETPAADDPLEPQIPDERDPSAIVV